MKKIICLLFVIFFNLNFQILPKTSNKIELNQDTVKTTTIKSSGESKFEYSMYNFIGYAYWLKAVRQLDRIQNGLILSTIHGLVVRDNSSFANNSFRGIGLSVWKLSSQTILTLFLNARMEKYLFFDFGYSWAKGDGKLTYFGGVFFPIEVTESTRIILDLSYGWLFKPMYLGRIGINF